MQQKTKLLTCESCKAMCCRYVTIKTETPLKLEDFDYLKWLLSHEKVSIFIDLDKDGKEEWYVEFITPCKFLGEDSRCKNYDFRSDICREYNHDECEFYNEDDSDPYFTTIEELEEYMKKKGFLKVYDV